MDPITVAYIGMGIMLAMIAMGVPIAFAMTAVGAAGTWVLVGPGAMFTQLQMNAVQKGMQFTMVALPMFILMGQLVYHARIAEDLYDCVQKWFGRMPGGLAITSVAGCACFGAVTGSSVAAVATIAPMCMPEMRRYNYDMKLATGAIASAGTLAMLIPPSVILVAYGIWTETSIGALFMAGILPGLLMAAAFGAMIAVRCLINPELGPVGPRFSWRERFVSLWKLLPILAIFVFVLGGIYTGSFTPSEASGMGVAGVFAVTVLMGRFTWKGTKTALIDAGFTTGMIFMIIFGGHVVAAFLVVTGFTDALIAWITSLEASRYVVLAMFVVMYLFLGMILDVWAMLIMTMPFVYPVVLSLGFDPIWFGVFLVVMVEIALITPPVGINVYVMNNMAPDVPLIDIFKGTAPFVVVALIVVAILTAFPEIALFLPELAFG